MSETRKDPVAADQVYAPSARALHWGMAALILVQAAMGVIMVQDGPKPNIWATIAERLHFYDWHKLLGVVLLGLALLRLGLRIVRGVPPEEPTIAVWQREASTLVHAWMYLLLIVVPVLGWLGVSLYPALTIFLFGDFTLPGLLAPDEAASAPVFRAHRIAAVALIGLIAAHVGAALYHHVVRRDGVLARMWPSVACRR